MLYLKIPLRYCSPDSPHRESVLDDARRAIIEGRCLPCWAICTLDADRIVIVDEQENQS